MDYIQQVDTVIRLLTGHKLPRDSKPFLAAIGWAGYQGEVDQGRKALLFSTICDTFDISETEIYAAISGRILPHTNGHSAPSLADNEANLEASISSSWLSTYTSYTRGCEAPLSYHLFSSLVLLGAALGRRVYRPKGHFNIYPNLCAILIGPPGRVRKSTAVGIARGLVIKGDLCPVLSDKITPESLVTELVENGANQFIGAPELSVFLGRQRYNEGLIPLLLRLLDTNDEPVKIKTVSRGEEIVDRPTLCMLGGSTMSLLTNATADQVAGSGFLSRMIPVVEQDTPRCFYNPPPPPIGAENELQITLARLKQISGEMSLTEGSDRWLEDWYNTRWKAMKEIEDEMLAQCMERGPVHLERMAMLLSLADHNDLCIREECFHTAATLLSYAEARLPKIVSAINTNVRTGDTEFVLEQIRKAGGAIDHSKLLRSVSNRGIDAATMRRHIDTLKEQGVVSDQKRGTLRFYILETINHHA